MIDKKVVELRIIASEATVYLYHLLCIDRFCLFLLYLYRSSKFQLRNNFLPTTFVFHIKAYTASVRCGCSGNNRSAWHERICTITCGWIVNRVQRLSAESIPPLTHPFSVFPPSPFPLFLRFSLFPSPSSPIHPARPPFSHAPIVHYIPLSVAVSKKQFCLLFFLPPTFSPLLFLFLPLRFSLAFPLSPEFLIV